MKAITISLLAFLAFLWFVKRLLRSGYFDYPGQEDVQPEQKPEDTFPGKDCRPQAEHYKKPEDDINPYLQTR